MNTIYRLVWNVTHGMWVPASELVRSRKKGARATMALVSALCVGVSGMGVSYAAEATGTSLEAEDDESVRRSGGLLRTIEENGVAGDTTSFGNLAISKGAAATAFGYKATANEAQATAIGSLATALEGGLASGYGASAAAYGVSSGYNAAGSRYAVAVGSRSLANGAYSVALGSAAYAPGNYTMAIGANAVTSAESWSMAIGAGANATADMSMAIGAESFATARNALAVGMDAKVTAQESVAIGKRALAEHQYSVALGAGSSTSADYVVSVGSGSIKRRIMNVAEGVGASDAATVGQLNRVTKAAPYFAISSTGPAAKTSLASSLAIGESANSTYDDAVVIGKQAAGLTGDGATAVGAQAVSTHEGATSLGWKATASKKNSVALGRAAAATGEGAVALGANSLASAANTVSVGSTTLKRRVVNLADGIDAADAVTVRQHKALGTTVSNQGALVTTLGTRVGDLAGAVGGIEQSISLIDVGADRIVLGSGADAMALGNSIAVGKNAKAIGTYSVALGYNSVAGTGTTILGTAVGVGASATANRSAAIGATATASYDNSIAVGAGSATNAVDTVSMGNSTLKRRVTHIADGIYGSDAASYGQVRTLGARVDANQAGVSNSLAVLNGAVAWLHVTPEGISLGEAAEVAKNAQSLAVGTMAKALGMGAVALGAESVSGSNPTTFTTAVGMGARAHADSSSALGANATAGHAMAVALGAGSATSGDRTVSIGNDTLRRRLTNLDNGVDDNDAVNLAQLKITDEMVAGAVERIEGLEAGSDAVSYVSVMAVGDDAASATGNDSVALGNGAWAGASGSVALGSHSEATEENVVSVGNASTGLQRRIANVADGMVASDAATVGQLDAAGGRIQVLEGELATHVTPTLASHADELARLAAASTVTNRNFAHAVDATAEVASASSAGDLAIGSGSVADSSRDPGHVATAIGQRSAAAVGATALGADSYAGSAGVAVGTNAEARGSYSVAIGDRAGALGARSFALGTASSASGESAIAIGLASNGKGNAAISLGHDSESAENAAVAIGTAAKAAHQHAVALGDRSATDADYTVSVGSSLQKRRITNLANGVDASDAATVDQLRSSSLIDADGRVLSALTYSGPDYGLVSLAGIQGTRLTNLADGLVAVGSRDAINGGQLASLRDQLADRITGIDQRVETLEGDTEPAEPISRATARSFAAATPSEAGGAEATVEAGADAAVAEPTTDAVAGSRVASARATPARVENVAAGEAPTDAANVSQLNVQRDEAIQMARSYTDERVDAVTQDMAGLRRDVQSRFQQVDRRIDRMAAMSGAYAGMAMNTAGLDGANRVGAGVGTQRGQKAIAVGYQHVIGKRASFSIGGAAGGSDRSVNAGAGFSW